MELKKLTIKQILKKKFRLFNIERQKKSKRNLFKRNKRTK
mgnify:CR=1 FL=1